jgi:stage IV sporulation protein FB
MMIPGRIPIVIQPWFWIFAALIGWFNSQTLVGMLIWIVIIFVSVLFHEFGHALTALSFRQTVQIQLVALGGVTTYDGPKLSFWKQFLIVLNGPLAGIGLFLIATGLLYIPMTAFLVPIIKLTQIVNLFWSIVNLLPVLPLDGGHLLRIALEGFFGVKGFKASLLIGMAIALTVSFAFFLMQAFLLGAFFFLFAYMSFDAWRKSRWAVASDREDDFRRLLAQGEELLQKGNKEEAQRLFEEVRDKAQGGILAATAAQYLSFLYVEQNRHHEAYELLLPLKRELTNEGLCLLHQLAELEHNPELVTELSTECYQCTPNLEVALRNARAFAQLKQPQHAGGWLQTAWQHGPFDLEAVIHHSDFSGVKDDPQFRNFVDPLR